jgi:hypothetical protein
MRDALWDGLTDSYAQTPMGVTAENLAKKYGITREVCSKNLLRYLPSDPRFEVDLQFAFNSKQYVQYETMFGYRISFEFLSLLSQRNVMLMLYEVNKHGHRPMNRGCLLLKWHQSK